MHLAGRLAPLDVVRPSEFQIAQAEIVHTSGGHPGGDAAHASIRRFTAPRAGTLSLAGKFKHGSENGDGVRGRVVSSRGGLLGEWRTKNNETATDVPPFAVEAGDTLDFVVDCLGAETSDSYAWTAGLTLTADGSVEKWESSTGFHGPVSGASLPQQAAYAWKLAYLRDATRDELELACRFVNEQAAAVREADPQADAELSALTSLCQQLFSSNEFLYVD